MLTMTKRLGEILLEKRMLEGSQLHSALLHQRSAGGPLGQVLLDLRLCTQEQLLEALSQQTGVPSLELDVHGLDFRLAAQVPRRMAERHRVVPLRLEGPRDSVLVVAIAAPASFQALEAVRTVTNKSWVVPKLVTDEALCRAIEWLYPPCEPTPGAVEDTARSPTPVPPRAVEFSNEPREDETFSRLIERHERPVRGPARPPVLIYGWKEAAAHVLVNLLRTEGHRASLATEEQVAQADEDAVVIAPLPWLEALRRRPRARMLAAGREAYRDGMKARMLGAQGFVVAPLDEQLLLREVTRLSGRMTAWAVGE
jgi:type IV pilus assembly protein PilB